MKTFGERSFLIFAKGAGAFQAIAGMLAVGGYYWMLTLRQGDSFVLPTTAVTVALILSVASAVAWCLRPSELRQ
jgi:hypothetical protein